MSFLVLLDRYAPGQKLRCFGIALVGGVLAASVIAVANAATAAEQRFASWKLGIAFLLALAVMYGCQRIAARYLVIAFEDVVRGLRDDLATHLCTVPLRTIERLEDRLGQASGELTYLAGAVEHWAAGVQHVAFLISLTLIVGTISLKAFIIWVIVLGVCASFLRPRLLQMEVATQPLGKATGTLTGRLEQLLDGFVQVKLDGQIAAGITDDLLNAANDLYRHQLSVRRLAVASMTGTVLLAYLFGWGPAAFADPAGIGLGPVQGYELVLLLEMGLGPLFGLLWILPEWARVDAASKGVAETLDMLSIEAGVDPDKRSAEAPKFETIALQSASFTYTEDGAHFEVGPIDLTIRRGELILIAGGNGCGKTTLMKMILGLYALDSGTLRFDDTIVTPPVRPAYRNLFTAIFSHQHLFSRLYGLSDSVSQAQVDALLTRFGIQEMTSYKDGAFDRIDLSTGQKMRLAMVVALLEDRPICVFDEWTGNQDPEMTSYYYDTVLPELTAAGKTVIAVSHDGRFFDRADHFIAMADGRVIEERRREPTTKTILD